MILNELFESDLPELKVYNGTTNVYSGQVDGTLYVYDKKQYPEGFDLKQTDPLGIYGYIDWSIYKHTLRINMIETHSSVKRKGVATLMIKELKKWVDENNYDLEWTFMTSDGEALRKSLEKSNII